MRVLLIDGDRRHQAASGYGRLAAALAEGLPAHGHEVVFGLVPPSDVCLYVSPPFSMEKVHTDGLRVGFTMHELDTLQPGKERWPAILNRLDLVLTPTAWNRDVWRRLGVTTPIEVVPLGVDPELYHPAGGDRCVFLSVHEGLGSPHSRENWTDSLHAYYGSFTADDPVAWRVKTWNWEPDAFALARAEALAEHGLTELTAPPIELIDAELSHRDMRALYLEADLFVKNANREGWSIPCTEAVACGTAVAAARIEPLVSHLPDDVHWFGAGDRERLGELLRERAHAFEARQQTHYRRHTNAATCAAVSAQLTRYFGLVERVGTTAPPVGTAARPGHSG
jgi:glycosyltransferase involved in cell wall biosynthesis